MSALPWVKVYASLPRHPKALALSVVMGSERAWTWLVHAWLWVSETYPSGVVPGANAAAVLEAGVRWDGVPGHLVRSMRDTGWLDETPEGLSFHDWAEHQAAHRAKAERDAARKRERRASGAATARAIEAPQRGHDAQSGGAARAVGAPPSLISTLSSTGSGGVGEKGDLGARVAALREALDAVFLAERGVAYRWTPADEMALPSLLAAGDLDTNRRHFRNGLRRTVWPRCGSVADLNKHWNHYAQEAAQPNGKAPRRDIQDSDYREGEVTL